jgi:hypothetical protein
MPGTKATSVLTSWQIWALRQLRVNSQASDTSDTQAA